MPRSREIITCQIGPFSNWVGAHYWNTQDDARHPVGYEESGDPMYEDEQADSAVLYRSSRSQLTPRLVVCDVVENFGNLSTTAGGVAAARGPPPPPSTAVDALSWGGNVTEVVREAHTAHPFAQFMSAPSLQEPGSTSGEYGANGAFDVGDDDEEQEDDEDEDEDDEHRARMGARRSRRSGGGRRSDAAATKAGAGRSGQAAAQGEAEAEAEEEEEALKAAAFDFEGSVQCWSDYLQAHLHPRSLAPLKPHAHNYSTLSRFPDGAAIVEKEEDCTGGPGLVERVRRFLEECDSVQGFHFLLDADGGFGGAATALLTQIRDDYSRAPCLALGLGSLSRPKAHTAPAIPAEPLAVTVGGETGLGSHGYAPALNDAMSLSAFAELNTCYVPLYGSAGLRALLDATTGVDASAGAPSGAYTGSPSVRSPPLLAPRPELRYHTSAPIAALFEAVTLPYRARSAAGSLNGLVRSLSPRGSMHLAVGVLGMPMPSEATALQRQGWLAPMVPLQRAPAACRAFEQQVCWLGHKGGGRAVAPLIPSLLPCRSEGGAMWVRPQPFSLPLSFPQFFSTAVGCHGEVSGAPTEAVARSFVPELERARRAKHRSQDDEVLDVSVAAALQCSPSIMPVVRRVCADWATEKRAAERAGTAEGWAQRDELAEVSEGLAAIREAYAEGDEELSASATSGWSSG